MRPTYLTPDTAPETFIGAYGTDWRSGLLSEHLELFKQAGGTVRPSAGDGAGFALIPLPDGGMVARPVVCSELVRVDTEDGPVSGRCGHNALEATGTCHRHDFR